jgi:hypothetical protein
VLTFAVFEILAGFSAVSYGLSEQELCVKREEVCEGEFFPIKFILVDTYRIFVNEKFNQ